MSSGGEDLVPNAVQSFEIHGSDDLPKLEPFEFQLDEELSQPYKLLLRVVARDPSIDESKLVGQSCTLTLTRGGLVRHINGIVLDATFSGIALDAMTPQGNLPTGVVDLTIVPAVELLRQRKNNRIFSNLKVTDILKQVLGEALGDYSRTVSDKTTKNYQVLEYCTQFDETDFDFVHRLMGTEGIMWYFQQGETAEELILFDSADKYIKLVTMDHGKVPFETHFQAEHITETVTRFTVDTRLTPTTATVRAFNWSKASEPDETSEKGKDSLKREREWYLGEAPVGLRAPNGDGVYDKTSAEVRAKVIRETAVSRTSIAGGDGDVTGFSPGVIFDLDNALRDGLNRKYLVIQVSHRGVRPGDTRRGTFNAEVGEVTYTNTFKCVASDVLYRLETPPRRFVQTMQTATVVGAEDIDTDPHGRVMVQFHWARVGKKGKSDVTSCFVRVAQPSAGIGYGHVFIPRKGQEVVVTFLEGDPDKPLIIGSVYNAIHTPPYDLKTDKTRSVIRTRSTPNSDGYNEISFEDNADHEELYIQAQKDMKELVKHDHTVEIGNDEHLDVKKNQTEDIGENQDLTVGGNRTRSVAKNEQISVEGNRTKDVTKNEDLTVGGNRSLSVSKNETISIDGSHTVTVGKTVSQTYSKDHTRSVSGNQTFSVTKDKTEEVQGKLELTVVKNRNDTVQGAFTVTVQKAYDEKCDDSRKSQIAKDYSIKSKKLTIEVEDEVSIKVGDSSMVLKKDSVVIKSAKATVNSSGNVTVKGSKVGIN